MIHNIDQNVGQLLSRLEEWNIAQNTLVIFMNDNGGTNGVRVFNAGMRGSKGSAWEGGTRASSFWRWPGTLKPADCPALTAHIDVFPTVAELAGVEIPDAVRPQVEGRSLVPLLKNPQAAWPDRYVFAHQGRWPKFADPNESKFQMASVRTLGGRWSARNPQTESRNGNCSTSRQIMASRRTSSRTILKWCGNSVAPLTNGGRSVSR